MEGGYGKAAGNIVVVPEVAHVEWDIERGEATAEVEYRKREA